MADGSLGQDDIDKLLSDLGASEPTPAEPTPAKPPTARIAAEPAAKPPTARTSAQAPPAKPPTARTPAPAASDGMLDQDAIDALIAQTAEVVAAPLKPAAMSSTAGGHLDQSEIDKLLADLDPQSRKSTAASSASAHLDQKDIDRLLNELDVTSEAGSGSEVLPATGKLSATPAPAPAVQPSAPTPAVSVPAVAASQAAAAPAAPEGPLSQDAIDKMLAELGAVSSSIGAAKIAPAADTIAASSPATATAATEVTARPMRKVPPAPEPVAAAPSKAADATQALSADEIDAIVAKQGANGPPGHESEAVIAQSDIDALVKQLAQATGSPEAQEVAQAIAGKAADIDRIQAEAGAPQGPEHTRDAVDVNSVLGHTASTASLHTQQPALVGVATVATMEWKAARWLLAAAVLLLGICSGALIVLTMSVSGLSGELRAVREVEHPAVDGYADQLRLALAKIGESDEAERARGVRWMEELKRNYPDRAGEVGLALARHFRSREAWRRAADEYGAALETTGADDPRVLLEHADCLTRLGDDAGAIRQVYTLLAAEAQWTAERDAAGRTLPGLERNRQAIADAYLMLGRLLTRDGAAGSAPVPVASAEHAPAQAPPAGGHH